MDEYILKHLHDVYASCMEVENYFRDTPKLFDIFSKNILLRRAVERNVEIMGEAINRILKIAPDFTLTNAKEIVRTRNRIIHGYDSVTLEFLWSLVINHIPALKKELEELLKE